VDQCPFRIEKFFKNHTKISPFKKKEIQDLKKFAFQA
jgi:hypothetical protein